jgi:hypothetical protein
MAPGLVARVVIVCAVFMTARPASAERRTVAVVDLSASEPAKQLGNALYLALVNHAALRPLDNPDFTVALQGPFADEDAERVVAARRAKQEANDYLTQLDDVNAARTAGRGMEELASVMPTSEVLGVYAELAFAYGQAQLGLRKPNDASLAFQLAHRLDPSRRPDPTLYPPNIVQAYNAAANKSTIAAKLEVKGDGRVWIDGVERGPANASFDTSEGLHLVQLSGPERETRGKQVQLPQTTPAPVEIEGAPASEVLKVQRARIALAKVRDDAERASAMKRLGELLGVRDAVLIMRGEDDVLLVQTWRIPEPGFSKLVVHRNEPPIDLLTPLAPPPPKEEPSGPIVVIPPVIDDRSWYQRRWVQASIAGTVVLGIVGAILYARRDQFINVNTGIDGE